MTTFAIDQSPSESSRFGLTVGRAVMQEAAVDVAAVERALVDADVDVVVLRYPNRDTGLFASLMELDERDVIFADCLMYWQCELPLGSEPDALPVGIVIRSGNVADVEPLVRSVFSSYPNHYSANPLFGADDALEGYVEWVSRLVSASDAECLVFELGSEQVGFSIVDLGGPNPDIRLAGISPAHRGQGHYDTIIRGSMNLVRNRDLDHLRISTQAHNLAVMRTWARRGWLPFESWTTVHLVRKGLLA